MKAFLSYQFKDNVNGIVDLLLSNDIEVFDSMTDLQVGKSFQKAIKESIEQSDFVVLIYTAENPNIAFEAGIAVSLNKPVFSVISELSNEPDFLFDSAYVHAQPDELEKIEYSLKIFLDRIKPKKRKPSAVVGKHKFYGGGYPNYYDQIFSLYRNISGETDQDYEYLFKKIFELYGLSVIQNKIESNVNFVTDFCIWSDELNNVIGNPILVEIKREINDNNFDELKNTVLNLVKTNSAECCLVFYEYLRGISKRDLPNSSRSLFIEISDFVEKFRDSDFNGSIRKIRNEIVHNQL